MSSGPTHCEIGKDDLLADQRGELAEAESAQLATHVSDCPVCREEKDEMVRTAGLFDRLPEVIPSTDSWSRMLVKIEDVRNEEGEAPANDRRRLFSFPSALKLVLPLAAAALLVALFLTSRKSEITPRAGEITVDGAAVRLGDPAEIGPDAVVAAAGLARLTLLSRRRIETTLGPDSRLVHLSPGRLRLETGRMLADVRPGSGEVTVEFPGGVLTVAGTVFGISIGTGQAGGSAAETEVEVSVIEGEVTVTAGGRTVTVVAGTALTVPAGGPPTSAAAADPWRVRDWCSAPTATLEVTSDRLLLTLSNHTVSPLVVMPFDPAEAAYAVKFEGEDGRARELKVQDAMVSEGGRVSGEPAFLSLAPGESYRLAIDLDGLPPLSPGAYRVSAVYKPYRGSGPSDWPRDAWRGIRETPTHRLIVK